MQISDKPVPVFINPESGSAGGIIDLLQEDKRLEVHAIPARQMAVNIRQVLEGGAQRIMVSGGDGTIALAAGIIAGTGVELGIVPGGTLNHFAVRMGIPLDPLAAIELALTGMPQAVDVGYVNERLFINTSSVGAYARFVRTREHLEKRMGYHLASLLAALRRVWRLSSAHFVLDGHKLRSPMIFIGVDERELGFPSFGQPRDGGKNGLHLIAACTENPFQTLILTFNAFFRGIDPLSQTKQIEDRIIDTLELGYRHRKRHIHVATDGELTLMSLPLRYRHAPSALRVIIPG